MKTKKYNLAAIGILIGLTIIYFWKFFFLGHLPIPGDIISYTYPPWSLSGYEQNRSQNPLITDPIFFHYPIKELSLENLSQGKIHLWNSYIFCGTPMLGSGIAAVFSPLNIFFCFFSSRLAYTLYLITQFLLAPLFMYLFLKSIRLSCFASLLGSIVFMLNGFFIVWLELGNTILTGLWLPLLLLLTEKIISQKGLFYPVVAGIALGLQFFSGHLQVSLYVLLALGVYSLFRIISNRCFSKLVPIGLVFVLGFGLGAIHLLPCFEMINLSHRTATLPLENLNPLPVQNLITLIIPDYYGHPVDYNYNAIRCGFNYLIEKFTQLTIYTGVGPGGDNYCEYCCYIGILPLILGLVAVFLRRDRLTLFFAVFTLCAMLLALGTPLNYLFYYTLPGFNKLALSRMVFLFAFGMSVLAGIGGEELIGKGPDTRQFKWRKILLSLIGIMAALVILSLFAGKGVASYFAAHSPVGVFPETEAGKWYQAAKALGQHFVISNPAFYWPLIILAGSALLFWLNPKQWAKPLFLLITIIDLLCFGMKFNPFVPKELLYPQAECLQFLQAKAGSQIFRIATLGHILPPDTNLPYRLMSTTGYDSLVYYRYSEFMKKANAPIGMDANTHSNRKLLGMLNVRYILCPYYLPNSAGIKLILDGKIKVYEDMFALPRCFVVSRAMVLKNSQEVLARLTDADFNPGECVLLESADGLPSKSDFSSSKGSTAEISTYSPEKVIVTAKMTDNGFLVLGDTYYPGWKVFVDGRQGRILQANYILRAVYLPKGRHLVEFKYLPDSFKIGKYISLSTLSLCLFLALRALLVMPQLSVVKQVGS